MQSRSRRSSAYTMIAVRLNPKDLRALEQLRAREQLTRSEILRRSLRSYHKLLEREQEAPSPQAAP